MESQISITWTNPSLIDLQEIFDFYVRHSTKLADRIVERIVDRVEVLKQGFLEIGQIEPILSEHLLEGNHKIIYRIIDDNHVLILTVFDVRQDPSRLAARFE